ncbi:MAG: choice-of-anchor R domain-containing protein [Anaerolineales bacterium]|nr:choice-of-anchor R domain-containing protein [Anaerolineales bacterium]
MSLSVHLQKRSFDTLLFLPRIEWQVERLRWHAVGGPDEATIRASGPEMDLWECAELLRCPIEVHDRNQPVWWGYVEAVKLHKHRLAISVSVETMSNQVKVTYTEMKVGGVSGGRASTAWTGDDLSRSIYGTKEKIVSLSQGNQDQATKRLTAELAGRKYPLVDLELLAGGETEQGYAEITCRGWWHTMSWVYWDNPGGKVVYEELGGGLQSLGDHSSRQMLAMSFTAVGSNWGAETIQLRMKRENSPGDNLLVYLSANNGGIPGTVLASASMPGANVDENLNWHEFNLSPRVAMNNGTTYWIVIERSGAINASNYYRIGVNESLGYAGGVLRIWNGSSWVARSPDADMNFRVGGTQETSDQIKEILEDGAKGQFFTGVDIDAASGVFTSPFRDGDQTAMTVLEELMKSGGANGRRLLASVDIYRRVRIYEEPAAGEKDYFITSDGVMSDFLNKPLDKVRYPVGVWARLKDVIPASMDTSKVASIERVFLEEVIYDADNENVQVGPRSAAKLLELE